MTCIPLVRANVMHGVIALLQQLDAPTERLLAEAKLPTTLLHDPEALFPLNQVLRFIEQAACSAGIEQFGLLVGQQTQIANLGALGRLLYHSPTLADAINTLIGLIPSYNSGDRFWLHYEGETAWLCRRLINDIEIAYPQAVHVSLMFLIRLIQLAAGSQWKPTEVHLITPPARCFEHLELFRNTKILFNQTETAIAFPQTFLKKTLQHSGQYTEQQRRQDYEILQSSAPATHFPAALRKIIGTQLKQGYPTIQSISEMLGVSVRSLQRQLHQANLTYSQLIEQVRLEYSIQLLRDPANKITDIATEIGYKDAGNFVRAFKRWTGVSPKAYSVRRLNASLRSI